MDMKNEAKYMKQAMEEIKKNSRKYKSIYKCRLCGKEFEGEAYKMDDSQYPVGSVYKQHKCDDGRYGVGDLLGSYEVNKCHLEI